MNTSAAIPGADARRWHALACCMAGAFISMLDVSIVNVALPSIEQALQAGATELQLVVAGYTLAFALVVVPAGRLGDLFGRKNLFIIGLLGFGVTSILAGLSSSDGMLAIVRVAQGLFAGLTNPQVSGLIQQLFVGRERGRAFGIMGAIIGVATALGPVAGGVIIWVAGVEHGWRWVFFINVPILAVVVPLCFKYLPGHQKSNRRPRVDAFGIALIGIGTVAFMAPFILSGQDGGQAAPERWWLILAAVMLLPVTYYWERSYHRRHRAAVFDPRLSRNSGFVFGAGIGFFYFAAFTSLFLIVTITLQAGLGYSPLLAGIVGVPFAIGSGLASNVAGRLVGVYGRRCVVVALVLVALGLMIIDLVLRFVPTDALGWALALAMFVTGIGSGSVISPNQTLTLAQVPIAIGSVAGAVLQISQQIGSAVGLAVVLSSFFANQTVLGPRVAAANALLVSIGLVVLALIIAVIDAQRRSGVDIFARLAK